MFSENEGWVTLEIFRNFAYVKQRPLHGNEIVQNFQNYKYVDVDRHHSIRKNKSSWKRTTLKRPVKISKVVQFSAVFNI